MQVHEPTTVETVEEIASDEMFASGDYVWYDSTADEF
jgi:hypothetical protein